MANKYRVGDVLYEFITGPNSIPWWKEQLYTVKKYDPVKKNYMIVGTADNYPRFYMEQELDITFRIKIRAPR
jgi:hypothetical protein